MQIAPCPGAGGKAVERHQIGDDMVEPEPLQPGIGEDGAVGDALVELAQPVCTLPRNITTSRSGRMRRISAWRRSDDEPTLAPCGRSMIAFAALPIKASRASSRGRKAESSSPSGNTVGMSFDECTAMSILPASSASSISLVNRPLPPASDSGRSWMRSPLVEMTTTSNASARHAVRRHQPRLRFMRLRQGQRAAACSDFQGCLHGARSVITPG